MADSTNYDKVHHIFKVLVVGEGRVGKTCYVRRCVHNTFSMNYQETIGVDFALKTLQLDQNTTVDVRFWDINGQQRRSAMTRAYYRDAVGALVVFDTERPETLDEALLWKGDVDKHTQKRDGTLIPAVLLANKCDVAPSNSIINQPNALDRFCEQHGFCAWFACSAKESIRVDESTLFLVNRILQTQQSDQQNDVSAEEGEEVIHLGNRPSADSSRSRGGCPC